MKQSEFKKRYDAKMVRYVKKHFYGEGVVTDVFSKRLVESCLERR